MEKITLKVDPRNARTKEYQRVIKDIISQGVCPFCPATFKWHTKSILRHVGLWFITENFNPYPNSQYHLLIIGKKHKELLSELSATDLKSIFALVNWATKKYKIKGGGITMRFGDSLYTGATVKHLHAHLIVPKVKDNKPQPVYFPIG